jgi:hypothetical protein
MLIEDEVTAQGLACLHDAPAVVEQRAGVATLPVVAVHRISTVIIPKVTPTATVRGPDHHRTAGSLTAIPPTATRPQSR